MDNNNCNGRTPVWREDIADKVADALIESGSYIVDFTLEPDQWFKWKSGVVAPCYCDCRVLTSDYQAYSSVVKHMSELVKSEFPDVELLAGIAASGITWSAQLASTLELPSCFVREKLKEHGVGKHVCCSPRRESKAVIVDDLCASGASTARAINALSHECEISVIGGVSIINWGFQSMWDNLGSILNCKVWSLCSHESLVKAANRKGIITKEQEDMLNQFYQDPFTYDWKIPPNK